MTLELFIKTDDNMTKVVVSPTDTLGLLRGKIFKAYTLFPSESSDKTIEELGVEDGDMLYADRREMTINIRYDQKQGKETIKVAYHKDMICYEMVNLIEDSLQQNIDIVYKTQDDGVKVHVDMLDKIDIDANMTCDLKIEDMEEYGGSSVSIASKCLGKMRDDSFIIKTCNEYSKYPSHSGTFIDTIRIVDTIPSNSIQLFYDPDTSEIIAKLNVDKRFADQ